MKIKINKLGGGKVEFDTHKEREAGFIHSEFLGTPDIKAEFLEHDRGGSCALFTATGTTYHDDKANCQMFAFDDVEVEGQHVPTAGSTLDKYIPNDPGHYRPSPRVPGSDKSHYLLGGEGLPIIESPCKEPSRLEADLILQILSSRYDLEVLKHPRMMHLLRYFGWDESRWHERGGRDLAWLQQKWGQRTGGSDQLGWYDAWQPKWGSGCSNNVYNQLFMVGLNYLIHRRPQDFHYGFGLIIHHCALGRLHAGSQKGWMGYTKGPNFAGESYAPDWAKQFPEAMYLWYYLTGGHPLIKRCIDDWHGVLSDATAKFNRKPEYVWQDRYGARRAARYLKSQKAAYDFTRDERHKKEATEFIDAIIDPSKLPFPNLSGESSPWQDAQVGRAVEDWGYNHLAKIIKDVVLTHGVYEVLGQRGAAYRYNQDGPLIREDGYAHHLAFMCGIGNPDLIGARVRDKYEVEPLSELGIEDDRMGLGWPRTSAYILACAMKLM